MAQSSILVRSLKDISLEQPADFCDRHGIATLSNAQKQALSANPFCVAENTPAQILGLVDGVVVGKDLIFPLEIEARQKRYTAISGSGLYVHEQYRSSMIGVEIVDKFHQSAPDGIAIGCGIAQKAVKFHRFLRYLFFGLPRVVLVVHSFPIFDRKLSNKRIAKAVSGVVDLGLYGLRLLLKLVNKIEMRGLALQEMKTVPAIVEGFNTGRHPFFCVHSRAWFQWQVDHKFTDDLRACQRFYGIVDKKGNIAGFFCFKVRFHETASQQGLKNLLLGSVTEWQTFDEASLSHATLLLAAALELTKYRVDAVEICSDEKGVLKRLSYLGFIKAGILNFVLRASEESPLRQHDGWDRQENWRLRPSEGDNGFS